MSAEAAASAPATASGGAPLLALENVTTYYGQMRILEGISLEVKAGDRVLFGKWSGTEVKISGEDLLIMKESDLLGVIEHHAAEGHAKAA